ACPGQASRTTTNKEPIMRFCAIAGLVLLSFVAGARSVGAEGPSEWRYVVPSNGQPFDHAPLRVLALTDERPGDLKEDVPYRGKRQRYAQLRYGSPSSVRIALVLDEIAPGRMELYADAHRNRVITQEDRISGDGL